MREGVKQHEPGTYGSALDASLARDRPVVVGDALRACLNFCACLPRGQTTLVEFEVEAFALDDIRRKPVLGGWGPRPPEKSLSVGEFQLTVADPREPTQCPCLAQYMDGISPVRGAPEGPREWSGQTQTDRRFSGSRESSRTPGIARRQSLVRLSASAGESGDPLGISGTGAEPIFKRGLSERRRKWARTTLAVRFAQGAAEVGQPEDASAGQLEQGCEGRTHSRMPEKLMNFLAHRAFSAWKVD